MTNPTLDPATCIVRNTASRKGRTTFVSPGRTAAQYLHYSRIRLDAGDAPIAFESGDRETGFICMRGGARVHVADRTFMLERYDTLYTPRESSLEIPPGPDGCDLVEIAAPVAKRYPVQYVPYSAVKSDPALHFETGLPGARRELNVMIGKNVEAGRIMAGVTLSAPGNWTSWPPHEHAAMLEEAYLYVEMPPPGFGIQLVYTNPQEPELVTVVRDGDIVLMPKGYHPNVAAPGASINFVWMMAARREEADRQYGVVNVQAEFASIGSGLDAARKR